MTDQEIKLADVIIRKTSKDRVTIEFPGDISKGFPGISDGGEISASFITMILARVANAKTDAEGCIGNVGCKDCLW